MDKDVGQEDDKKSNYFLFFSNIKERHLIIFIAQYLQMTVSQNYNPRIKVITKRSCNFVFNC